MARVEVQFTGVSTSAVRAARETRQEIRAVGGAAHVAERDLGRMSRGALAGSGVMRGFGRSVAFASASFLGAAGLIGVVKSSISEVEALHGELDRTKTVFRGSATEVLDWSKTTARSIGLARSESLKFANDIGTMLKGMGLAPAAAARMSISITKLAADIGAMRHADPTEVATAFEAAIAGRTRGLKQYGINIDQVAIKEEALRLGVVRATRDSGQLADARTKVAIAEARVAAARAKYGPGTTQVATAELQLHSAQQQVAKALEGAVPQLTAAQRAQVIYALAIRKTADAHGYFARHSHDAYEQERIFHAQTTQLRAALGAALLPTLVQVTRQINHWLSSSRNQATVINNVKDAVKVATSVVKDFIGAVRIVDKVTGGFKHTLELLIGLKIALMIAGWRRQLILLIGAESGVGLLGAAGAAGKLRLALATLYSTAVLGGLAGLLGILSKIAMTAGKVAAYTFGGVPDQVPTGTIATGPRAGTPVLGNPKQVTIGGITYIRAADGRYYPRGQGPSSTGTTPAQDAAARKGIQGGLTNQQRKIVTTALSQLGIPYQWGGAAQLGLHTDCSGLAQAVLRANGISVPRTTYEQWRSGTPVPLNALQPGDLVFYHMSSRGPEHVAIYIGQGMIVEDPHTGARVQEVSINYPGHPVGARRYTRDGSGGGGGGTGGGAGTGAGAGAGTGSLRVGTTSRGARGATQSTLIGVRASIDAYIREFRKLTPDVRKYLSDAGVEAEKHLEKLRAHLKKGMSATDLAQTRAGIRRWGKVLHDEISKAVKAAHDAATEQQRLMQRAIDKAIQKRFDDFNRETEDHNRVFERETSDHIAAMRKAFDLQMREFDRETQRGLAARAAPTETPEEAALRQFQEARQAEADAAAMQQALASGDPAQIRQLQLDLQERYLQAQADASRKAADQQAKDAQDAYQQQRDDLKSSLEDQQNIAEQAYQDERDAQERAYNDMRADQLKAMQNDLDDWQAWIDAKRKTWKQFLQWLSDHGFAVPGSWFTDTADEDLTKRFRDRAAALAILLDPRAGAVPMQHGGTLDNPRFLNRDGIPVLAQHGETVLDRSLTDQLERTLAGGGLGGGPTVIIKELHVIGTTPREVWRGVARGVEPALKRRVGFERN